MQEVGSIRCCGILFWGLHPFPAQALLGRFFASEDDAFPRFDNFRHLLTLSE